MSETTMGKWELDPVSRAPSIVGPLGRAWEIQYRAGLVAKGIDPERDCTVASWLIEAPWAHPFWHSYYLVCIYLRPNPRNDVGEPIIHLPGATHEFWLMAVDPREPRERMVELGVLKPLEPMNFAAQFIAADDGAAVERIRGVVVDICAGRLSPDTDFTRQWVERFGDNMLIKTFRQAEEKDAAV